MSLPINEILFHAYRFKESAIKEHQFLEEVKRALKGHRQRESIIAEINRLAEANETAPFRTMSGWEINLLKFDKKSFNLHDATHALAGINRFNAQTPVRISVLLHSLWVYRVAKMHTTDPKILVQCLAHDFSEAYVTDVTYWLKRTSIFAEYRKLEKRIQSEIYAAIGVPTEEDELVHRADKIMVRYEARRGFGEDWICPEGYPDITPEEYEFYGFKNWFVMPEKRLRSLFLDIFETETGRLK